MLKGFCSITTAGFFELVRDHESAGSGVGRMNVQVMKRNAASSRTERVWSNRRKVMTSFTHSLFGCGAKHICTIAVKSFLSNVLEWLVALVENGHVLHKHSILLQYRPFEQSEHEPDLTTKSQLLLLYLRTTVSYAYPYTYILTQDVVCLLRSSLIGMFAYHYLWDAICRMRFNKSHQ